MLRKLTRHELQKREVAMLDCFDQFCKKYGLNYSLCGGTLLGAVRHKGFIPWDDDLDVCMSRTDYKKFNELFKDTEMYSLYSDINGKHYKGFARLYDVTTIEKNNYFKESVRPHLWMDIFPVDGLPEDDVKLMWLYKIGIICQKFQAVRHAKWNPKELSFRNLIRPLIISIAKLYGGKWATKQMNKFVKQYPYETSQYVGILTGGIYGVGERMEKDKFEKQVKVNFEGKEYPTFSCWHEYLTGIYGDYMKMPPEDKRTAHNVEIYVEE